MFRYIVLVLGLAVAAPVVQASEVEQLSADLSHFVTEFDLHVLDSSALDDLRNILENADASHGQKVFALHSLLDRHGALGHADMHGARNLMTASIRD